MPIAKLNAQLLRRTQREISSRQIISLEDDEFSIEWWVLAAAGRNPDKIIDLYTEARRLLRISKEQADRLFIGSNWPLTFCRRYRNDACSMRQVKSNARVTAERINHFIQTEGM